MKEEVSIVSRLSCGWTRIFCSQTISRSMETNSTFVFSAFEVCVQFSFRWKPMDRSQNTQPKRLLNIFNYVIFIPNYMQSIYKVYANICEVYAIGFMSEFTNRCCWNLNL